MPNGGDHSDPVATAARRVERARRRVEGELIGWLLEVDRTAAYVDSGYADVAAWGRGELRWCPAEARARRGLMDLVRRAPAVLEQLLDGHLGVAQAHLLGRLFRAPRVGRYVPDFIDSFLRYATELDYAGFEQYCSAWRLLMDQDGSCPDRSRRSAHLGFVDHEFRLSMSGPAIDGVAWDAVLRRFEERELAEDWADARERFGSDATVDLLRRTPAQRRYDALQSLLAHVVLPGRGTAVDAGGVDGTHDDRDGDDAHGAADAADAADGDDGDDGDDDAGMGAEGGADGGDEDVGDAGNGAGASTGADGGPAATGSAARRRSSVTTVVNIVADLATWLHAFDRLTGEARGQPWVEPFGPHRGRCETLDGVQVHPRDAVLASLAGKVRAVVVDDAGRPVQMTSAQRLFRGAMADAVRFTASRCTHPGCLVPATAADVDHLRPHAAGGSTSVVNGGIACGRHNSWRYAVGATTTLRQDGVWVTHLPDGRRVAPPESGSSP